MKKVLRWLFAGLLALGTIWLIIYKWPSKADRDTFVQLAEKKRHGQEPLTIAHRGGAGIAPEGTLAAFDRSVELGIDMLEFDVHLTSDGELVVIHDPTVDRTTDGTGKVNEKTLAEVQSLDAGYRFEDEDGNFSFRGQGVYIPTLAEVFERYGSDQLYLIEFKDTNNPELYDQGLQELWRLIQEHGLADRVLVGSFIHDILEDFNEITGGQVAIGAGESEATSFVIKALSRLNGLINTEAGSLQLPLEQLGIDLTQEAVVETARQKGMHIYYWTINEASNMEDLIDKQVDGIMTDYPDLLIETMEAKR